MSRVSLGLAVLLGFSVVGCGGSSSPEPGADAGPAGSQPVASQPSTPTAEPSAPSAQPAAQPTAQPTQPGQPVAQRPAAPPLPANTPPDQVVSEFLKALKGGNDAVAANLLTVRARTETARHDLTVQPPGTPTATYRVGKVEFVTQAQDGAHVGSIWTEKDGEGDHSYQITWVLRKQTDGWRIAGMATAVVPGQPPLFLNFEDPADMIKKWEHADAELARRNAAAAATAQQPKAPGTSQK